MPRPKRSKIAPSAPAVLPAKILASIQAAKSSSSITSQRSSNSDDSEGMVKRKPIDKRRKRDAKHDIYMAGALPPEEKKKGSRQGNPPSRATRAALMEITRNADFVKRKEARVHRLKDGLQAPDSRDGVVIPSSLPNTEDVPSDQAKLAGNDTPQTVQKQISQRSAMPSVNWRAQATPRVDSSILALGNFKRRSRQPSLLGIGRPDDSPSLGSFDLGKDISFDEPELPNKVVDSQRAQNRTNGTVAAYETLLSASRHAPSLSSSSRKRKRSPEILVRRSQSPTTSDADRIFGSDEHDPPLPGATRAGEDDEPDLPAPNLSTTPPEVWSETMAPPESSSPQHSNNGQTDLHTCIPPRTSSKQKSNEKLPRPKPVKSPKAKSDATAKSSKSRSNPLGPLSTTALQSLLPRRRHRDLGHDEEDEIDVPSSDHELEMTVPQEEDDELSFMPVPKKKAPKGMSKIKGTARTTTSLNRYGRSFKSHTKSKSKTSAYSKTKGFSRTAQHNEARHTTSSSAPSSPPASPSSATSEIDKELAGPDTSMESLPPQSRKELKKIAKKFEEVDKWEMEFEEITASSSSPRDAR